MTETAVGRRPPETGLSQAAMMAAYERGQLDFLTSAFKELGPVVRLGPQSYLVAEPKAVVAAFQRTGYELVVPKNVRWEPVRDRHGEPRFESWMAMRKALTAALKDSAGAVEQRNWLIGETDKMLDGWVRAGTVDDPVDEFEVLLTRARCRLTLGPGQYADRFAECILQFGAAMGQVVESPAFSTRWTVLPRYRRFRKALNQLDGLIEERVSDPDDAGLVGRLRADGLDGAELSRLMLSLVNAGFAFTSVGLAWSVVELCRSATHRSPESLPNHIEECLRLWPPSWMILRETVEDVVVGGWRIPKDSGVMIPSYVVHRTAPCFEAPDEYRPERWPVDPMPPGSFFPFGGGPRWCVGAPVANVQLQTVLGRIAERVEIDVGEVLPVVNAGLIPRGPAWRVRGRAEVGGGANARIEVP